MKLPTKRPSTPTKPPKILADLYADLRDRRLLPVVIGLLVAVVAVPFVLGASPAPPPGPAATPEVDGAGASEPAVQLISEVALRDYRKRLGHLSSKDPFAVQEEIEAAGDELLDSLEQDGGATPGGSGPPPAPTTPDPVAPVADPAPAPAPGISTTPPPVADPPTTETGGTSDGGDPSSHASYTLDDGRTISLDDEYFAYRAEVEFGRRGELDELSLGPTDTLVDHATKPRKTPVATFVGADTAGERATFFVFFDASSTRGEGRCRPRPSECEQLTLEPGQKQSFIHWNDELYNLRLKAVTLALYSTDGKLLDGDVSD